MVQSVCILGRQPAFGLAELESLYSAGVVIPIGLYAAGLTKSVEEVQFMRLGGSTRLAKVLTEIPSTNWKDVETYLVKNVPKHLQYLPEGKLKLGLSTYGFSISPAKLTATGLTLKKVIRAAGRSVRLVPNTENELNTAQVVHNHLTGTTGWELLLLQDGTKTILAQTTHVQDIDSYTLRDRGRPKRDARVGMLPPKLAQVIVNLATGEIQSHESRVMSQGNHTVLDPFCGTGVLLQEALLMGYDAYGTDLDPRMIDYSQQNLTWLTEKFPRLETQDSRLEEGDATTHTWQPTPQIVACETYLGRPFTERPSGALLAQTISEVNLIIKRFLENLQPQLAGGTRMCLALPCWYDGRVQKHLPVLERLDAMGFERVTFTHAAAEDLVYHREGQIVGRELVTLVKK